MFKNVLKTLVPVPLKKPLKSLIFSLQPFHFLFLKYPFSLENLWSKIKNRGGISPLDLVTLDIFLDRMLKFIIMFQVNSL